MSRTRNGQREVPTPEGTILNKGQDDGVTTYSLSTLHLRSTRPRDGSRHTPDCDEESGEIPGHKRVNVFRSPTRGFHEDRHWVKGGILTRDGQRTRGSGREDEGRVGVGGPS